MLSKGGNGKKSRILHGFDESKRKSRWAVLFICISWLLLLRGASIRPHLVRMSQGVLHCFGLTVVVIVILKLDMASHGGSLF